MPYCPRTWHIEQGSLIYKKITLNCLLFPFLSKGDAPVKTNMAKKISSRHICMQPQVHCLMKELRSTYRGWRPGYVCANVYSGDGWIWDCGSVYVRPRINCSQVTVLNQIPLLGPHEIWISIIFFLTSVQSWLESGFQHQVVFQHVGLKNYVWMSLKIFIMKKLYNTLIYMSKKKEKGKMILFQNLATETGWQFTKALNIQFSDHPRIPWPPTSKYCWKNMMHTNESISIALFFYIFSYHVCENMCISNTLLQQKKRKNNIKSKERGPPGIGRDSPRIWNLNASGKSARQFAGFDDAAVEATGGAALGGVFGRFALPNLGLGIKNPNSSDTIWCHFQKPNPNNMW